MRLDQALIAIENSITIRQAGSGDLALLYELCRKSYTENYADHWNDGGLDWYLAKVYGWETIKSELSNPNINYFIAFANGEAAGFMKLRLDSNLPGHPDLKGMELDKIYFRLPFKGKGIGKRLMALALTEAKKLRKEIIWLGVIDTNSQAIGFYQKAGFEFHEKTILDIPYFKEELKGMWRMKLNLPDVD